MAESRREFIQRSVGLVAICCGTGSLLALKGCVTVHYVSANYQNNNLVVKLSDMEDQSVTVINNNQTEAPLYLRRLGNGDYRAFLMLCTHKGCTVKPAGAILICPCHGSEFSGEGVVLKGPATETLAEYPVTVDSDNIYIELR